MKMYRVYVCKQCGVRRRIFRVGYRKARGESYTEYKCSKGHTWEELVLRAEHVGKIMQDILGSKIQNLFDRDDTFYKKISRR